MVASTDAPREDVGIGAVSAVLGVDEHRGEVGQRPRRSGEHSRQVYERAGEDGLVRRRQRQMDLDLALEDLDPGGEFDHAQAQRIELDNAPERAQNRSTSGVQ